MIYTKNIDLTPSIESLVNQKVEQISRLIKSSGELAEVRVEVGRPSKHHRTGKVYYAEVNLKLGKKLFRATAQHMELEYAVVAVRDEIERQLKKFKTKRRDLSRQPRRKL